MARWTEECKEYVRKYYREKGDPQLAEELYKKFGFKTTSNAVKQTRCRMGISSTGRRESGRPIFSIKKKDMPLELREVIVWLTCTTTDKEISELISAHSEWKKTARQISTWRKRYGFLCGRTGQWGERDPGMYDAQFKKGQHPSPATEFKKGHVPHNKAPINAEVIGFDGYTWVKIAEPDIWRQKAVLIYEEKYGPIPEGKVLIRIDQDKRNDDISNLRLVSRGVLGMMNKDSLWTKNAELNTAYLNLNEIREKTKR